MLELGNFGVGVCGEFSFRCKACRGEGCADLHHFWSGGELGGKFGGNGNVFEVPEAKPSEVEAQRCLLASRVCEPRGDACESHVDGIVCRREGGVEFLTVKTQ